MGLRMGIIGELRRRNVFRVAVAYIVASWLLLQATEVLSGLLELPPVLGKGVVLFLALGFLPVLAFAWAFELTPEGIKRESEVDRSQSVVGQTGRKLNALIIAMLVVSTGYFFWESRFKQKSSGEPAVVATPVPATRDAVAPAKPAHPAEDKSIAVLPFVNMSSDAENEYFADGLSEEILNQLAQVAGLRVIGRTSSFAFKGQNLDLREIGNILGAATLLEGSVRRQGDQVRVTAQLIASDDGAHLWSQNFDRKMDDVFAIQDEIAERVVAAMDIVLDETSRAAMQRAGIRDVEAFMVYQKGYEMMIDAHGKPDQMEQLLQSLDYFDQAIAAVPDFAQAYSAKTDYYAHVILDIDHPREERESALVTMRELNDLAYEKARDPRRKLAIDVDRLFFSDDWTRLPRVLDTLFETEGCAEGNWMEMSVPFAPREKLLKHFQQRIECDPLMLLSHTFLAIVQMRAGDLDEAAGTLNRAREYPGNQNWLSGAITLLSMKRGESEQALQALMDRGFDGLSPREKITVLRYLAALDRVSEARALWDQVQATEDVSMLSHITVPALLGDRDAANAAAAVLDAEPGGFAELLRIVTFCLCGAPFDLEATPHLAERVAEAGWDWPPPKDFDYPAKGW
jgi:TolB-like protein